MNEFIIITVAIGVLVLLAVIITALFFWKRKKKGKPIETDYQVFFILGIIFMINDI